MKNRVPQNNIQLPFLLIHFKEDFKWCNFRPQSKLSWCCRLPRNTHNRHSCAQLSKVRLLLDRCDLEALISSVNQKMSRSKKLMSEAQELLYCPSIPRLNSRLLTFSSFLSERKKNQKQESPAAWTQEAYRPPRSRSKSLLFRGGVPRQKIFFPVC